MTKDEIINNQNLSKNDKYVELMKLKHDMYVNKKYRKYHDLNSFIPDNIIYTGEVFKRC